MREKVKYVNVSPSHTDMIFLSAYTRSISTELMSNTQRVIEQKEILAFRGIEVGDIEFVCVHTSTYFIKKPNNTGF